MFVHGCSPLQLNLEPLNKRSLADRDHLFHLSEVKNIARQLLTTLNTCHEEGVAHLDIKPANLLWDGSNLTLIDWGESRFFEPGNPLIDTHLSPGTESYRPQFSEKETDAVFLDTYAAGKTLNELLKALPEKASKEARQFAQRCIVADQTEDSLQELLQDPWLTAAQAASET